MEKCLAAEIDNLSSSEDGPCFASSQFLAARMEVKTSAKTNPIREMLSQLMKKGIVWQLGFDGRKTAKAERKATVDALR